MKSCPVHILLFCHNIKLIFCGNIWVSIENLFETIQYIIPFYMFFFYSGNLCFLIKVLPGMCHLQSAFITCKNTIHANKYAWFTIKYTQMYESINHFSSVSGILRMKVQFFITVAVFESLMFELFTYLQLIKPEGDGT